MQLPGFDQRKLLLRFVWVASFISLGGLILFTTGRGWDVDTYYGAMQALRAGLDPYATALARQYAAQAGGQHAFAYVYPPLTLLALRALNLLPLTFAAVLYWILYAAGFAGQLWAGAQCIRGPERKALQYAIPLAIFFPGLMTGDSILSGNVACIFYGMIFSAAVLGWKRGNWRWFYVAVLIAACFKAPLLTLLAIPLLAGERQWLKTAGVGAVGVAVQGLQSWIWPTEFREYLQSVALQFQFNGDFGLSPAGVLGRLLHKHGLPYSVPSTVAYVMYASVLFAALWLFSEDYRRQQISAESWIPVVMVGAVLLNPRIMPYDLQPLALPMALIAFRTVASGSKAAKAFVAAVLLLIVIDWAGISPPAWDGIRDIGVLAVTMSLGFWYLSLEARRSLSERWYVLAKTSVAAEPAEAVVEV